jgi:hypothetical protein
MLRVAPKFLLIELPTSAMLVPLILPHMGAAV